MKVFLISNYLHDRQESMQRFAEVLEEGLNKAGVSVELIRPEPFFGKLKPSGIGLGKWLGYIDKFILFPFQLRKLARRAKKQGSILFHICDHSYSMYGRWLRDAPCLITCHDLLAVRSALGEIPQNPTGFTGRVLQKWILSGLKRIVHAACVSEATRSDLIRLTGKDATSTSVVYNGLNYPFSPLSRSEASQVLETLFKRRDQVLPESFVFHIGGSQWYKNRIGLIRIYAELLKIDPTAPKLVIAGKDHTPDVRNAIDRFAMKSSVLHVGRVSNEELNALYSSAEAFLFPSLAEGFGWPIIEAQASGCQVVTTNRAPMNEIGGDAATYIDPEKPDEAAATILNLLKESPEEHAQRITAGLTNAARFSTEQMIAAYVNVYEQLLNSRAN